MGEQNPTFKIDLKVGPMNYALYRYANTTGISLSAFNFFSFILISLGFHVMPKGSIRILQQGVEILFQVGEL